MVCSYTSLIKRKFIKVFYWISDWSSWLQSKSTTVRQILTALSEFVVESNIHMTLRSALCDWNLAHLIVWSVVCVPFQDHLEWIMELSYMLMWLNMPTRSLTPSSKPATALTSRCPKVSVTLFCFTLVYIVLLCSCLSSDLSSVSRPLLWVTV